MPTPPTTLPQLPPSLTTTSAMIAEFIAHGGQHIVLSPGSRSAPIAYVAYAAAHHKHITLHVRIDERSAAYLALGIAKAHPTSPVLVAMTSGTAVANAHPAVLEAHHSGLPLIVMSADRPHELRGTGANQTTEQPGLFAHAPRLTIDLPAPSTQPSELTRDARHARTIMARSITAALGTFTHHPGPVHLNVSLRDPLAPTTQELATLTQWWVNTPTAQVTVPHHVATVTTQTTEETSPQASTAPTATLNTDIHRPIMSHPHTVVVAGDNAGVQAAALAERYQWPLISEPSSGAPSELCTVPAPGGLLRHAQRHPESPVARIVDATTQVIVCGHPTLTRPVMALMAQVDHLVIAPTDAGPWNDPTGNADLVIPLTELVSLPQHTTSHDDPPRGEWLNQWLHAAHNLTDSMRQMSSGNDLTGPFTPQRLAMLLSDELDARHTLVLGSSSVIRDLDLYGALSPQVRVYANRGLAGIDGVTSTALGIAVAQPQHHCVLVVGDLTFLHDINGLLRGPQEPHINLTIIVLNDDGGAIFHGLEHSAHGDDELFERVLATPHGASIEHLCAGYAAAWQQAETIDELRSALATQPNGIQVVELSMSRADRVAGRAALDHRDITS